MLARWLFGMTFVGTVVAACAQPPPPGKKVATCDPKISECGKTTGPHPTEDDGTLKTKTGTALEAPDDATKAKAADELERQKDHVDETTDTDTTATSSSGTVKLPPAPPDPPADANTSSSSSSSGAATGTGTDDPLADVGPSCTKLWACCANLRAAGITGSADQCDDSALGNDELTCDIANEGYKTADDNYDPVCF